MPRLHKAMNPGLADEWHESAHGKKGVNCYDCHKANRNDPGAFEHNGSVIHVIVSPMHQRFEFHLKPAV